jgi:hypothetical protein
MNAVLITVIWLQSAPVLQTQPMESIGVCVASARAAVQMIAQQATSNMTGGHAALQLAYDEKKMEW